MRRQKNRRTPNAPAPARGASLGKTEKEGEEPSNNGVV